MTEAALLPTAELLVDSAVPLRRTRIHVLRGGHACDLLGRPGAVPQRDELAQAVTAAGGTATGDDGDLQVRGLTDDQIADIAFARGLRLHHLAPTRVSLEQAFMALTADSVEYRAGLAAVR